MKNTNEYIKAIQARIQARIDDYPYAHEAYVSGLEDALSIIKKIDAKKPKRVGKGSVVMVLRNLSGGVRNLKIGELAVVVSRGANGMGYITCDTGDGLVDWYLCEGEYEVL